MLPNDFKAPETLSCVKISAHKFEVETIFFAQQLIFLFKTEYVNSVICNQLKMRGHFLVKCPKYYINVLRNDFYNTKLNNKIITACQNQTNVYG